jgi:selenophosphate synthetase-related protein
MLNTDRMARQLARAMLFAAFLFGYTPMLVVVADVPVAQAKPQHAIPVCSPSPSENCYTVYESVLADCDGMRRQADKVRCQKAAANTLAKCLEKEKDGFMGDGGRF